MRIKNNIIIAILLLISTACSDDIRYHSYYPIPATGWDKSDTILFNLPENFDAGKYRLSVELRHDDAYKYKDLWLEVRDNCKDSTRVETDTIKLILADKEGNWNGNGIGGLYQFSKDYGKNLVINSKGSSYKLKINQIMRDNPLRSIDDIGIKLIKIGN